MTSLGIASTLLGLLNSKTSMADGGSAQEAARTNSDFSSSLTLRLAELQSQSVTSLLGSAFGVATGTSSFDFLTDTAVLQGGTQSPNGLSASGRQLSLFDPNSAYNMMSIINNRDVAYKAQFSELSEMSTMVGSLGVAGKALGTIDASTANDAIKAQLQAFVGQYNEWVQRFGGSVKRDGLLAETQAAEVALHELRQSIGSIFNGASEGFHGMRDLGLVIDPTTKLLSLNTARFDAAFNSNSNGVVKTINEFSGNFALSAELLVSSNNFLPNRLSNLDRVIDYITQNKSALQVEFGLGDPARPSGKVATALAAYNRMVGL